MIESARNLTTRTSLSATAAHNVRWFASLLAGSAMLGASALAVNNFWESDSPAGSSDWDTPGNWSLGRVPANPNGAATGDTYDDAFVNIVTPGYPILVNNADFNPRDIKVGVGAGTTGRLDLRAGVLTGSGWSVVGDDGGAGTLNVADTSAAGGTFSGFAKGTGSFQSGFRLYVGGEGTGAAGGTANVNTSGMIGMSEHLVVGNGNGPGGTLNFDAGTINVGGESWIGQGAGGVGKVNMSGGILNSNSWVAIGREGGNGTAVITGGTWNKTGGNQFIVGDNSTGKLELPAGGNATVSINNQMWIGQNTNANGTLELHSGTVSVGSWVAIGRNGGKGTANMSGGTWSQTGGEAFIVGADGLGNMTMTGGTVNVANIAWVAETTGANGSALTLNGGAFNTPVMSVGPEGNGTLNLNGGSTLRTGRITGQRTYQNSTASTGTGTINFNGGQIIATAANTNFIGDVDVLNVAAGGLLVDSNGFSLTVPAALTGSGGVVKTGAGSLNLDGANGFTGASTINAGSLSVGTATTGGGAYTVADGAAFGVNQATDTGVLAVSNLTLGASALNVNAFTTPGNPAAAPIHVTGTLSRTGPTAINLVDTQPAVGSFPVVSYGAKTGAGTFVIGKLPDGVTLNSATPITDNGSVISLNITRVNAPYWTGANSAVWDTVTANWQNSFGGAPTTFANGDPAIFEDLVIDPQNSYDVTLNSTVTPGGSGVTFDNDLGEFTLTGSGKITGTAGFTKRGFNSLVIGNLLNEFTGLATLEEGTVSVGLLANAATGSPLGKGNLVLAGGTLDYTGPAVTIDRGFQINAASNTTTSELALASNVTMSGPVTATSGKFRLSGAGVLTLTNPGPISLANGPQDAEPASLVIDGAGLTLNGAGQTATVNGNTQLAVANGANTALTLSGDTVLNVNRFQVGFGIGSTSSVLIQNSARLHKSATGWFSIANSNDNVSTLTVRDSGSLVIDGGDFNVGDTATANGSLIVQNSATVTSVGPVYIGKNGTTGTVTLGETSTMSSGDTNVAGGNGSHGNLNVQGSATYTSGGRLQVGPGGGSTGNVVVEDSANLVVNSYVSVGFNGGGNVTVKEDGTFTTTDDLSVNEAGDVPATVTVQDTAALSSGGTVFIGRNANKVGTLDVSGTATFDQTGSAAQNLFVGLAGTGILNVGGGAVVTAASANGVILGNDVAGTGTVNLNGGTLTGKRIFGGAGTATFNFDGGVLKAGAGATAEFMTGLDNAFVEDGGARIDSNDQDINIAQPLLAGTTAGGGLTKSGTGTVRLNGANTYTGTTTVTAGALGGTGTVAGPVVVQSGAALAPGATTGTLTANAGVTFSAGSALIVNIDDSQTAKNGRLTTTGTLNVSGVALQVNVSGAASSAPYTIATAGTVTGTFASVPAGVSVSYNGNSITITPPASSPFDSWMSNFPTLTGPNAAKTADPDGDGMTNLEEFALDGNPASGGATGKVRSRIETVGGEQALVITLPVRTGASFDSNPGPGLDATVAADGVLYLIKGSNNLATFDQAVTEVSPASATGMPALSDPAKWGYRTFRLNGAIPARGTKGFLDVTVEAAP